MNELPFYCEVASKANFGMFLLMGVTFIFPIIPIISLLIALINISSLRNLKDSHSVSKEQLQERKIILIKRIVYASILPIIFLWFLFQHFIIWNLFGVTYSKRTMVFTLFFLPIIFFVCNAILLLFSYTNGKFSLKHNLKQKRMRYVITIILLLCYLCYFVLGMFVDGSSLCRL